MVVSIYSELLARAQLGPKEHLGATTGRSCAVLRARGQDVGALLIAEGLAREFECGRTSCHALRRHITSGDGGRR
jgi:hypothetical protein